MFEYLEITKIQNVRHGYRLCPKIQNVTYGPFRHLTCILHPSTAHKSFFLRVIRNRTTITDRPIEAILIDPILRQKEHITLNGKMSCDLRKITFPIIDEKCDIFLNHPMNNWVGEENTGPTEESGVPIDTGDYPDVEEVILDIVFGKKPNLILYEKLVMLLRTVTANQFINFIPLFKGGMTKPRLGYNFIGSYIGDQSTGKYPMNYAYLVKYIVSIFVHAYLSYIGGTSQHQRLRGSILVLDNPQSHLNSSDAQNLGIAIGDIYRMLYCPNDDPLSLAGSNDYLFQNVILSSDRLFLDEVMKGAWSNVKNISSDFVSSLTEEIWIDCDKEMVTAIDIAQNYS